MKALLPIVMVLSASNALAQDLEAGLAAVNEGDWDTAI